MKEKELLKNIAGLPREIAPDNDPWSKIEARLDDRTAAGAGGPTGAVEPHRYRHWVPLAVAATAVLAVVLVIAPAPDSGKREPAVAQSAQSPQAMPPPVVLVGSEAEYQAAFREFIAIGESRDQISPLAVEKIETGWADLRQVETALADALAQNPNDPFLNRRMLELRARQLGFLRQLAALDHSNRRLTI